MITLTSFSNEGSEYKLDTLIKLINKTTQLEKFKHIKSFGTFQIQLKNSVVILM